MKPRSNLEPCAFNPVAVVLTLRGVGVTRGIVGGYPHVSPSLSKFYNFWDSWVPSKLILSFPFSASQKWVTASFLVKNIYWIMDLKGPWPYTTVELHVNGIFELYMIGWGGFSYWGLVQAYIKHPSHNEPPVVQWVLPLSYCTEKFLCKVWLTFLHLRKTD